MTPACHKSIFVCPFDLHFSSNVLRPGTSQQASCSDNTATPGSDQAHKLSQAIQQDAMEAVREALRYEAMHEEVYEDVGNTCHLSTHASHDPDNPAPVST